MKYLFACLTFCFLCSTSAFAATATLHITIKNFSGFISVFDPGLQHDLTRNNNVYLNLDANQSASYTMSLDKPTYLMLYLNGGDFKNCSLFLSPGDELFLTADFGKKNRRITVTGTGSINNQPEIFALTNMDIRPFNDDAAPDRIIAAINKQDILNKAILANYIKVNKRSAAFVKAATTNLQYFAPLNYYRSYHSNVFGKPKEQQRKWQRIQDSLFSRVKLSNDDALIAYNYTSLVDDFSIRESDKLWEEYGIQPMLFYRQWFHCDATRGKQLFEDAQMGILFQKIIEKHFKGKTAEYAYAQALKYEYLKADYPSAILLFNNFRAKYPASAYLKTFSAPIAGVANRQQQEFSKQTVFAANNGTKLNTLNEVVKLTKGKAALVDMWGTWCGPCRQEIHEHARQLSAHFKGKAVNFIYVSNLDVGREKEWKKQIAYFQIEGLHILANPKLTKDIMGRVKATGYPTYIIIKKDGTYKQAANQYPINVQAMIKEIETASM